MIRFECTTERRVNRSCAASVRSRTEGRSASRFCTENVMVLVFVNNCVIMYGRIHCEGRSGEAGVGRCLM